MISRKIIFTGLLNIHRTAIVKNSNFSTKLSRLYCTATSPYLEEWEKYKSKYSKKDLITVLNLFNKSESSDRNKYDFSQDHHKILKIIEDKNILFKSLEDLILQDVINVSELDDICSIITAQKPINRKFNVVTPAIKKNKVNELKTAVSLRVGVNHISWTQLELTDTHCTALKWDCESVLDLSLNANVTDLVKIAVNLAQAIPNVDAYVIEKEQPRQMSKMNSSMMKLLLRQKQLLASIITVLSTRNSTFDNEYESLVDEFYKSLYTLKLNTSAQLFNLFLGNETVSSTDVVEALLMKQNVSLKHVTSVSINDPEMIIQYEKMNPYEKEELNKAFLVGVTFFELAVLPLKAQS